MASNDSSQSSLISAQTKVHLRHYWQVTLEHRWLVIIGFFICLLGATIYLLRAPKVYRATAIIQIDRESDGLFSSRELVVSSGREQDYLLTQYRNLQSPSLYKRVATMLDLQKLPEYSRSLDIVGSIRRQITIAPVRLTRLVEVRVEHTDPRLATNIANTLAVTFVDDNQELRRTRALDAVKWMDAEVAEKEQEVIKADEDLQKYKEKHDMVSLEASQNIVLQSVIQAQTDLNKAQSISSEAGQIASEVARMVKEGQSLESIPEIAQGGTVREIKIRLSERETVLQGLLTKYKEKWPDVISLRREVESTRQALEEECHKIYDSIQARAQLARATENKMAEVLATKQEALQKLNRLRIEYDKMLRKADMTKSLYNNLLSRIQEMMVSSKNSVNNMRVSDPAPLPLIPVKPNIPLVLVLGIVGGVVVGLGLAFFIDYLDDSIKNQEDIENLLRLPFLGYIPNIKAADLHERDLYAHIHTRSSAAESFRTMRAAITLAARADKMRVFGVTSSIPSEGKSLCASNFAIVTAQAGLKTVLVDADLRRPSVHKAFQIRAQAGLAAYLQGTVERLEDILTVSEVPNLDIIVCGPIPNNPSELLETPRMDALLAELRKRYDRVILDCPPISAVSDPLVMGSKADGMLYVMKFKKIRREHARRSVQRLHDAGIQVAGVILNDIDFEGRDSYYYSYYYYQNQYYSHYRTEPTKAKSAPPIKPTQKT